MWNPSRTRAIPERFCFTEGRYINLYLYIYIRQNDNVTEWCNLFFGYPVETLNVWAQGTAAAAELLEGLRRILTTLIPIIISRMPQWTYRWFHEVPLAFTVLCTPPRCVDVDVHRLEVTFNDSSPSWTWSASWAFPGRRRASGTTARKTVVGNGYFDLLTIKITSRTYFHCACSKTQLKYELQVHCCTSTQTVQKAMNCYSWLRYASLVSKL